MSTIWEWLSKLWNMFLSGIGLVPVDLQLSSMLDLYKLNYKDNRVLTMCQAMFQIIYMYYFF